MATAGDSRGRADGSSRDSEETVQDPERLRSTEPEPGSQAQSRPSEAGSAERLRGGLERHGRGIGGGDQEPAEIPVPPLNVENVALATEAAVQVLRQWSGPMPDPATLRGYEEVLPGAAERILQMAEVAAKGHHEINLKLAEAEISSARVGRNLAFLLALVALVAAIGFFAVGNLVAGGLLLSTPVVLMIQAMVSSNNDPSR
jgi:uncharacterized membrane protein